ncbi:unnamed protein product [Rotaria sp. Silwood1]|nr:unnamed protein product [Rotaria sp. Silwood1]
MMNITHLTIVQHPIYHIYRENPLCDAVYLPEFKGQLCRVTKATEIGILILLSLLTFDAYVYHFEKVTYH